jgi:hypothetical protein
LAQASAPIEMGADLFFDGSYVSSARPAAPALPREMQGGNLATRRPSANR